MKAPRDPIAAMELLDDAGLVLSSAGSRAGLGHEVSTVEAVRKAAEKCESDVSDYSTELSLDRGLYDALSALDPSKFDTDTNITGRKRCATSAAPASIATKPRAPKSKNK